MKNWNQISENLKKMCEITKDTANLVIEGIEEELSKEKKDTVSELKEKMEKNPNITEEEIAEFLSKSKQRKSLKEEFQTFKEKCIPNETIEALKKKIETVTEDKDVKKMREVLNMTSSLNDIVSTFKECSVSIGNRVKDKVVK